MDFNDHSNLAGMHAFLSPSKHHWVNYPDEKLDYTYSTHRAAQRGTERHEFAAFAIRLGEKLRGSQKTLNMYVNDAIGYRMTPEVVLFYSPNCFGSADAICFRNNVLRIHDYKSGVSPAKMTQLEIYAALFCLEYNVKPAEITTELRIYKEDEIEIHHPDCDRITHIMDKIITFDRRIEALRAKE